MVIKDGQKELIAEKWTIRHYLIFHFQTINGNSQLEHKETIAKMLIDYYKPERDDNLFFFKNMDTNTFFEVFFDRNGEVKEVKDTNIDSFFIYSKKAIGICKVNGRMQKAKRLQIQKEGQEELNKKRKPRKVKEKI